MGLLAETVGCRAPLMPHEDRKRILSSKLFSVGIVVGGKFARQGLEYLAGKAGRKMWPAIWQVIWPEKTNFLYLANFRC